MRREARQAFAPDNYSGISCRAGMLIGLPAERRERGRHIVVTGPLSPVDWEIAGANTP